MKKIGTIIGVIIIVIIVLFQGMYIVNEQEQVVITQFGEPIGEPIMDPGVHFKTPFIQKANFFEKRYLEWDGDPNQVPTKDKKYIFVDTYARWQITNPLQFFKRLRDERGAQSRLDDILDGETRDVIASQNLEEAVRSTNRTPETEDSIAALLQDSLTVIEIGRDSIQKMILKQANEKASDLGIAVLDFRFKRINYVQDVRDRVYDRMRSERFRIAEKFRSEGQGEASSINGEKERDLQQIQSEAFKTAEEIKGDADATAANIYSSSYNKSSSSRELYSFLKSLETLEKSMDTSTTVILSTESELYQYLKGY